MISKTLLDYSSLFQNYLIAQGLAEEWAIFFNVVLNCIIAFSFLILIDIGFRRFVVGIFNIFSTKTKSRFDDYLVQSDFPKFIARLLPISKIGRASCRERV